MAEEQPVLARRLDRLALVQEGAERRDAGAGADHDDRLAGIGRQREIVRLLYVGTERVAGLHPLGEAGGADAEPLPLADFVAHAIDRQRQPAGRGLRRRRDRVEPRTQR